MYFYKIGTPEIKTDRKFCFFKFSTYNAFFSFYPYFYGSKDSSCDIIITQMKFCSLDTLYITLIDLYNSALNVNKSIIRFVRC